MAQQPKRLLDRKKSLFELLRILKMGRSSIAKRTAFTSKIVHYKGKALEGEDKIDALPFDSRADSAFPN